MAEVVGSRVERRRTARERRAQALRAEARRFRRAQAMGAAMAHRGDFFLKGLECGHSYAVVCWCRKVVSLLCLFLVLPFLIWLFQFLQRRILMVRNIHLHRNIHLRLIYMYMHKDIYMNININI